MNALEVKELESVPLVVKGGGQRNAQVFSLSLNGVTVKVCSLGASIIEFLVPSTSEYHEGISDDIVLGYASPLDMWIDGNPVFFGAVVGRVANRIAQGQFQLEREGPVYKLEQNNGPNHLHGGSEGFSHCIWDAEILDVVSDGEESENPLRAVRFSLLSKDGDQGYPGSVQVSATYSLRSTGATNSVRLCLELEADLIDGKSTPLNLAQHSYFNLAGHDDPSGILDHHLEMANCTAYTPLDDTQIPTRQVRQVSEDRFMDWRTSRLVRSALADYAVTRLGLSRAQAITHTQTLSRVQADIATVDLPNESAVPYGFDHNYVIEKCGDDDETTLTKVAVLAHPQSRRRLTVHASTPGVQLYTSNYLNGTVPPREKTKNGATYGQWHGLCLETQHYPDSILVDKAQHPDFAKGACRILTADEPHYYHCVEYVLEYDVDMSTTEAEADMDMVKFRGSDSEGREYESVEEMWRSQLDEKGAGKASWYSRAATYYDENCSPTIDGVLGGYASISECDLAGSRNFIDDLVTRRPSLKFSSGAACECGAGIGRVTKEILLSLGVTRSDLVESSSRLLAAAPEYLGDDLVSQCRFYCVGLQDWEPKLAAYAIIWVQWVLIYLTDEDAISFLRRCGNALVEGGVIVFKENTCADEDFVVDVDDASVTRSVAYWKSLCGKAGLNIVFERMQNDFPDELFPVLMIALEKAQS